MMKTKKLSQMRMRMKMTTMRKMKMLREAKYKPKENLKINSTLLMIGNIIRIPILSGTELQSLMNGTLLEMKIEISFKQFRR